MPWLHATMPSGDGYLALLWQQVALQACKEAAGSVAEVHFVLFGELTHGIWRAEAEKAFGGVA